MLPVIHWLPLVVSLALNSLKRPEYTHVRKNARMPSDKLWATDEQRKSNIPEMVLNEDGVEVKMVIKWVDGLHFIPLEPG